MMVVWDRVRLFLTVSFLVSCLGVYGGDWKAGTRVQGSLLTEDFVTRAFGFREIDDVVFGRMRMGGSFPADCTVARSDLRYVWLLYVGYDGGVYRGEMVCNRLIAEDIVEIFRELYRNGYRIGRMVLIDEYEADDVSSMRDNNTSCFCFRRVAGSKVLSKHAMGLAVDVNPLYNPYVRLDARGRVVMVSPDTEVARKCATRGGRMAHLIDRKDLCYRLFVKHGFRWGGDWRRVKDYQHFER